MLVFDAVVLAPEEDRELYGRYDLLQASADPLYTLEAMSGEEGEELAEEPEYRLLRRVLAWICLIPRTLNT